MKKIEDKTAVVKYFVGNPVRDLMLIEYKCFHAIGRAVRYAMLSENGYSNHIMSLTGHSAPLETHFSTNILFLTEHFTTLFITTADKTIMTEKFLRVWYQKYGILCPITSSLPNLKYKTTSVEDKLSHIINLITSLFAKRILKLGNKVFSILSLHATEVVLLALCAAHVLMKLGGNKVLGTVLQMPHQKWTVYDFSTVPKGRHFEKFIIHNL